MREMVSRCHSRAPSLRNFADLAVPQLDGRAPASIDQRSGILAFQVHQLAEVECRRTFTTRKQHEDLPSSYVGCFLNDEKIFQTRVKPVSLAQARRIPKLIRPLADSSRPRRTSTPRARSSARTGVQRDSTLPSWTTVTEVRTFRQPVVHRS